MRVRRALAIAFALALPFACDSEGPSSPPGPSGPAPDVVVDVAFGEPPVEGTLRIVPREGTADWSYHVDPVPPATEPREGVLTDVVEIPFRFDAPGVHVILVELTGPEGSVLIPRSIVVVDPESDFEVLAQRPIEEIWPGPEDISPEGIVLDPDGRWLYAASYRRGELVRIDPQTLEVIDRVVLGPMLEGLTVTPGGDRLFAIHKGAGLSIVDLETFTSEHIDRLVGGFFIRAVDDSHALIGGYGLQRLDVNSGEIERASLPRGGFHFAVFPDRSRVVSAVWPLYGDNEAPTLEIFSLPNLAPIRSIPIRELKYVQLVGIDPSGDTIYVFGREDSNENRFLAVNAETGDVITSMPVGGGCSGYCVANPVATFGGGRYIAFEQSSSVLVVDTALDQPRYRFGAPPVGVVGGPAGVAAQPDSDVLYVLGGPYDALMKIRLKTH